eukprot:6042462-Pleurochrysis_carterae.AAC.1
MPFCTAARSESAPSSVSAMTKPSAMTVKETTLLTNETRACEAFFIAGFTTSDMTMCVVAISSESAVEMMAATEPTRISRPAT